MSAPRWTDVYAGLLALLPTLPEFAGVEIYDGQPVTQDLPMRWVTVGYENNDAAGQFQQVRDPSGFATQEAGEVLLHVACNTGDTDPTITRTQAFTLVGALQTAITDDPSLMGHLPPASVLTLSSQVMSVQNSQGSASSLLVTVHYQTLTYNSSHL